MGLSRDTFYRYKAAVDEGGVDALFDQNRRKPYVKNHVDKRIEMKSLSMPWHFRRMASNELRKRGTNALANFKQRLKTLEAQVAEKGLILTEAQVVALER